MFDLELRPERRPLCLPAATHARRHAGGEAAALDYDPVCSCQDYRDLQVVSIHVMRASAVEAAVRVQFVNAGQAVRLTRELERTSARTPWRIADIRDRDGSLVVRLAERPPATR